MITFKAKNAAGEIVNSALTPFVFPAGEAHIKFPEGVELQKEEIAILQPDADSLHTDLFILAAWSETVHALSSVLVTLVLPYMPGARADRGTPFGLGMYRDFLANMNIDNILIFDPHSFVTLKEMPFSAHYLYPSDLFSAPQIKEVLSKYDGIIAPDKGAVERAAGVSDVADLPVFTATKHRDESTGKLSNFQIDGLDPEKKYLIIDDICDGGGTFLGLAAASGMPKGSLDLYVSHGVFSKEALKNLSETFGHVYTTNSYNPRRVLPDNFTRFDIIRPLMNKFS